LLTCGAAWPLAAQPADPAAPDTTLPAVSVVATRTAQPTVEAPSRVTVLDAEAIGASGAQSVADVLAARSAVFVRRYGAGLASLSLRGTGAAQTLVLLDGHRIADPQLGQLDLSLLPTVLLESVEVLHGAGSALYGTDGLGGVVNLRTVRAGEDRFALTSTAGAWGERALSGLATVRRGAVSTLVAAETRAADGDFPTFDPSRGLTGATVRREGADRTLHSVLARVAIAPAQRTTRGQVAAWVGVAERGLPGTLGSASQDERQWDRHLRLWGDVTTRLGAASLRVGGLVQGASLRYRNESLTLDDTGQTWIASGEAELRVPVGARWLVAGGVTGGYGTAAHPNLDTDAAETRFGAFIHATGEVGRLLVYPALRADLYLRSAGADRALAALSPRLGLNLQPVAGVPFRLKANAGLAFRAPTFNDRFWQPGGVPDLRPERGWTADVGAVVTRGGASAEVTAFAARYRDQIVWQPSGEGFFAPQNLRRTRTLGVEASARYAGLRLGRTTLGGGLLYALTDARDRSQRAASSWGQQLRYVPRHQVKAHADLALPLSSRATLRLDLGGRLTSARPVRSDGSLWLPAEFALDSQLRLRYAFDRVVATLALAVENTLDADLEVVRGYPLPPRHLRARLHLSF
jgi:iron complex outermembrane receptor protein